MSEEQTPFQHAKPTPGPYTMSPEGTSFYANKDEPSIAISPLGRPDAERQANAALCFEAFNVHHETGLTPRQLAEQRAELLEALSDIVRADDAHRSIWEKDLPPAKRDRLLSDNDKHKAGALAKARAAIAKARGGAA